MPATAGAVSRGAAVLRGGVGKLQITTEPDNRASRRVIEANGGELVEEFVNDRYGPETRLRYVIDLN